MDQEKKSLASVEKLKTFIPGFDVIGGGGIPRYRTTLVAGTAGSAKTVFACQFLAAGIVNNEERGVFVTFEEPAEEIIRNMRGFGWDIQSWIEQGKWAFVDASNDHTEETLVSGTFDFGALLARIEYAVQRVGATRVSLDSIGVVSTFFAQPEQIRREMLRISSGLRQLNITCVITAERVDDYGPIARYGVEEFIADNVIILRNALDSEKRRRTIEILKYRGTNHQKGEFPFTVISGEGVVIIPLSAAELTQKSSSTRLPSGNSQIDEMCGGGFFQDSIILVSGATGTGKTLMATTFMGAGPPLEQKSLLFAFEESRDQLFRNAEGWGIDYKGMEERGLFKVICEYPESASLEDHLINIKKQMDQFKPRRVAIDSLSALERISTTKGFREFVVGLTSFIKERQITGMFTATAANLLGGTTITETHISTITDSIILLRYVEVYAEMRRGVTVLKMRGSAHDKQIREFLINNSGLHLGRPFRNVTGILSGNFTYLQAGELERVNAMFGDHLGE
jgi:circadian clock protein KaiC